MFLKLAFLRFDKKNRNDSVSFLAIVSETTMYEILQMTQCVRFDECFF